MSWLRPVCSICLRKGCPGHTTDKRKAYDPYGKPKPKRK